MTRCNLSYEIKDSNEMSVLIFFRQKSDYRWNSNGEILKMNHHIHEFGNSWWKKNNFSTFLAPGKQKCLRMCRHDDQKVGKTCSLIIITSNMESFKSFSEVITCILLKALFLNSKDNGVCTIKHMTFSFIRLTWCNPLQSNTF